MAPAAPSLTESAGLASGARVLGNGTYWVLLTAAGTGVSQAERVALTRWRGDRVADADGFFLYLRDLERGDCWSAGLAPTERLPAAYEAASRPGIFSIAREDSGIESRLEVGVVPDRAAEVRRLTLVNRSARRRVIEITSYAEVVLNEPAAHEAHPVFSQLFVQTEYAAAERALLARRRPRAHGDEHPWLVHAISAQGDVGWETDRARFLRRGAVGPQLAPPMQLSGSTGNVLDPIVSLRAAIELAPGEHRSVAFLLGAAPTREDALALPALIDDDDPGSAAVAAAETAARECQSRLRLTPAKAEYWETLAGALLYGSPALRADNALLARVHGDPSIPQQLGFDPRVRQVLLHAETKAGAALLPEVLRGNDYWKALGLPIELWAVAGEKMFLKENPRLQVNMVRAEAVLPSHLDLISATARLVIKDALPTLRAARAVAETAAPKVLPHSPEPEPEADPPLEALQFWNGHGGFSPDGREYVIRIGPAPGGGLRLPPRPWTNVIANARFGFLVSETGAGNTWGGNSRIHRLTPWSNDPLLDPHDEAFYVRDEETGHFWSPLPGPAPLAADYEVRHGFGVTSFRVQGAGLEQETTLFVPLRDPLRMTVIRLRNTSGRPRRLTLFAHYRLVLGSTPAESGRFVTTEKDSVSGALFARNRLSAEYGEAVAFSAIGERAGATTRSSGDRAAFLGPRGSVARPAAVASGTRLDGRTGAGLDPCFAEEVTVDLAPNATTEVIFLFGEGTTAAEARTLIARYSQPGAARAALEKVRAFWEDGLAGLSVSTPAPAIDLMVNGWLPYQALSCRIWGRTAFYQSGGAFGFRDQLQDAASLVALWPALTRAQILLHAAHQFEEGDVLHWWHPPLDRGLRTRCSDDLVWLPYLTAHYIATTGDQGILDEQVPFVTARALEPEEDEAYLTPVASSEIADLYTHCCMALDRALTAGAHGLPLFGTGDWNDGMNRVGREGRGESVWLGFFLLATLGDFLPLAILRGDEARVVRYRAVRKQLLIALNDGGWDGEWYRRGYYDSGDPLGSRASDECQIDALAQAWAVISVGAPPERAMSALEAVERHLVCEGSGMIRLLTPPFEHTPHDPGYIKGYVPGARENGGQYTHAALWVVRAFAEFGWTKRAAKFLTMLSPVAHAGTPDGLATYGAEPYVVAADIHGAAPHVGRAGWTWYTGSAGWMYRVAIESLLGFRLDQGRALVLTPRVPADWPGFKIRYRLPGEETRYEIEARMTSGKDNAKLIGASVDGASIPVHEGSASIPLVHDGATHRVELQLAGLQP